MARTWVVYESMFGNGRAVAQAIAEGLGDAELHEVGSAPPIPADVGLLVIGGPTHAFGMTRESTRQDARTKSEDGRVVSEGVGIREWLDRLPMLEARPAYAVFDTRINHPRLPGSAARKAAKRLRRLEMRAVADPESFWVEGVQGPLVEGELDRARAWGAELAALAGHGPDAATVDATH